MLEPNRWVTSSKSAGGNCVEVKLDPSPGAPQCLVRDSKDPRGPVLCFSGPAWDTFIRDAKDGLFDRS